VPRDATVLRPFEAVGFETFWLSAQERSIAWPDAKNQVYSLASPLDREALLPLLKQALERRATRKLIILHANNAHAPYPSRYRAETAPFTVDATQLQSGILTRQSLTAWWDAYDNAVDESMRFLHDVVAQVQAQPGQSVVFFTPDHGENLLDDARGLAQHALKFPTLWDTAVPAIVWTNAAWRRENADKWDKLVANRAAPLMHMDVVPTMLGAAGIRYREPRNEPVDLTARIAAARMRWTQVRAGETVTLEVLRQQAQAR
jgi:glucan phosphoethanolaminetransferase (alkaline phosphatase superfamily)